MAATSTTNRLDVVTVTLLLTAGGQLLTGLIAFLVPGTFYEAIGPYPPENGHFIKDLGSWQIALGVAGLLALRRPSWRTPMLGILALQFGLHTVSHVIDVDRADPSWQGPAALVLMALGFVVTGGLFLRERRR
jgi:hypothetical protein